jgi:hypothetical protein
MPIKKPMQDIQDTDPLKNTPENTVVEPVITTKSVNKAVKRVGSLTTTIPKGVVSVIPEIKNQNEVVETVTSTEKTLNQPVKSKYKNILKLLLQIKPIYLIIFGIIFLALITLIFIPKNSTKDSIEQSKEEVEVVKKLFSKHIILPENEQIDIRKITNKIEDPFFKDAEVGDYLIIFYKNRIAYIYSINKDIIINAGVVFIDPKTASSTTTQ